MVKLEIVSLVLFEKEIKVLVKFFNQIRDVRGRRGNFDFSYSLLYRKAGVPALIDAGEMAGCPEVDRRSMITYLHTVYKVLWHDKQEKK